MEGIRRGATAARWLVAAALIGCAASCSSSKHDLASLDTKSGEWDATVDRTVRDPARAARVKALGAQLAELQRTMALELAALNVKAEALKADYAATPDQEQELAQAYVAKRRSAFGRYRDLVFEMRREVSAQEWKELSRYADREASCSGRSSHTCCSREAATPRPSTARSPRGT